MANIAHVGRANKLVMSAYADGSPAKPYSRPR
jgi:hypothetical protein